MVAFFDFGSLALNLSVSSEKEEEEVCGKFHISHARRSRSTGRLADPEPVRRAPRKAKSSIRARRRTARSHSNNALRAGFVRSVAPPPRSATCSPRILPPQHLRAISRPLQVAAELWPSTPQQVPASATKLAAPWAGKKPLASGLNFRHCSRRSRANQANYKRHLLDRSASGFNAATSGACAGAEDENELAPSDFIGAFAPTPDRRGLLGGSPNCPLPLPSSSTPRDCSFVLAAKSAA